MIKNTINSQIIVITLEYRGAAHDFCNLSYKTPKKNFVVFHTGFKYDYHFIIKELAN